MKRNAIYLICLCLLIQASVSFAQLNRPRELRRAGYTAPDEIVSLSHSMPFSQALLIFNDLSKKYLNKIIVDPEGNNFPIGIDIDKMHWMDAFDLILKQNNLWYQEYPDYIKIIPTSSESPGLTETEKKAMEEFKTREVVISAIFFETDQSKLRQAGMSWDIFRGKDLNAEARLSAADSKTGLFEMDVNPNLDFGNLLAVFKALESDKIGEIMASPQITVKSEQEGRIQVGSDISVTLRDFAGNTITQFYSTGSIVKVKPVVIQYDSIDFIHLDLDIERSNTANSTEGLEIKKSSAKTSVLLLDGEETIIGGLYINEESNSREGVPLLKDLPWWFFGLRYVFGFSTKNEVKKELLILLKADLLPTLEQRFKNKMNNSNRKLLLRDERRMMQQRMRLYELQSKMK
ncbi:MAG: type II and III secretion system protein [Calditrichota bacterium]